MYENAFGWLVAKIRRYKPLVCVTQDICGEYGRAHHLMVANMVTDAVTVSGDSSQYPESAATYGIYDVPKTYLHLWQENPITLDTRKPLTAFGGRNALEAAETAYLMHESQQEFWFHVSDTNKYSIADFGLYKSAVGPDDSDDMMDNLISYREQERLKEEEASREAESIENSIAESVYESIGISIAQSIAASEEESTLIAAKEQKAAENRLRRVIIISAAAVVLALCFVVSFVIIKLRHKNS